MTKSRRNDLEDSAWVFKKTTKKSFKVLFGFSSRYKKFYKTVEI